MNRSPKMSRSALLTFATLLLLPLVTDISLASAQEVDPALYSMLSWRSIGPFRGGRSQAVAGVPSRTGLRRPRPHAVLHRRRPANSAAGNLP